MHEYPRISESIQNSKGLEIYNKIQKYSKVCKSIQHYVKTWQSYFKKKCKRYLRHYNLAKCKCKETCEKNNAIVFKDCKSTLSWRKYAAASKWNFFYL